MPINTESKTETPWGRLDKTLDEVMEREKVEGMYPVRGPLDESDDEEDEESDDDVDTETKLANLSEEKCKKCRWILVGKSREKEIEKGNKLGSGGQSGDMLMMFNTSTGSDVIMKAIRRIAQIKKLGSAKEQFDALLGFKKY